MYVVVFVGKHYHYYSNFSVELAKASVWSSADGAGLGRE